MSFFDPFGNILPNSNDKRSENPSTFNAAYLFSRVIHDNVVITSLGIFKNKYSTNGCTWRTMERDPNPDWSLDEKIATLAVFSYYQDKYWLSTIPLLPSSDNSSKWSWYRPDVLAYTVGSRWPIFRPLCWPIVSFKIFLSFREFLANPEGESSGVQLAFIKLMGWKKFDRINAYRREFKAAFDIYYPDKDHPIRELWR